MKSFVSKSTEETMDFGIRVARILKPGDIVCLFGDLGAGKTTLIKGIASGLRLDPADVHSPTFTLMNIYKGSKARTSLFHFDFYRMEAADEICGIGYDEFLYGEGISLIEWPVRMQNLLPEQYLKIELCHRSETSRVIKFKAVGGRYVKCVEKIR